MKPRLSIVSVCVALLVIIFFAMSGAEQKAPEAAQETRWTSVPLTAPLYREGELLVMVRKGVLAGASVRARSLTGATLKKDLKNGMELVKLPAGMSVSEGYSIFMSNPEVLAASPNYIRAATATVPDDADFSFLWGMHNVGQTGGTNDADIDAPEAWDLTVGDHNIIIAIVDSGVDLYHLDLVDNLWQNPFETPGNGIDDDDNGYLDDMFGIDTVNDDVDPSDDFGHGTHVAGTVGAVGDNAEGVAGVNWDVQCRSQLGCPDHGSEVFERIRFRLRRGRDRGAELSGRYGRSAGGHGTPGEDCGGERLVWRLCPGIHLRTGRDR